MSMRAHNAPRRVYTRNGLTVLCFGGLYFGPGRDGTKVNTEREVKFEVIEPAGGRKRIQVTQKVGKATVKETWRETTVPIKHRKQAKAEAARPPRPVVARPRGLRAVGGR